MINDKSIPFSKLTHLITNEKIPTELVNEIKGWNSIIKSPYGNSFYNGKVGWNYKEDGSLRISDHWNFESKGKLHCQSDVPVPDNHWAIGRFDMEQNKYIIQKVIPPTETPLKNTLDFQMTCLEFSREIAIEKITKFSDDIEDSLRKCEIGFLNKYFKILEEKSLVC